MDPNMVQRCPDLDNNGKNWEDGFLYLVHQGKGLSLLTRPRDVDEETVQCIASGPPDLLTLGSSEHFLLEPLICTGGHQIEQQQAC